MKAFLLNFTWLLLLLPALAGAQQVRVLSEVVDFSGEIGSSQRKTIILHNESSQQKTYFLKNIRGGICPPTALPEGLGIVAGVASHQPIQPGVVSP